jgi:hypothetical protein
MSERTYKRLTPGEMILYFIEDMGVTQYQLAKNACIAHSRLTDIIFLLRFLAHA